MAAAAEARRTGPARWPAPTSGRLLKQSHGAWVHWNARHFWLKEGCLYWSSREIVGDGAPGRVTNMFRKASFMDFSNTPCEVFSEASTEAQIRIQPVLGNKWCRGDGHRGAGTSRTFLLDLGDAELAGMWLRSLREHIAAAQALRDMRERSGKRRGTRGMRLQVLAAEDLPQCADLDCPVCLDEFGQDDRLVVRTNCGHHFHACCLHEWSKISRTCPLCKAELKRSKPRKPTA